MKNVATNTLQYAGIVTVSQRIGNNKIKVAQIHNSGSNLLFDFIIDCLAGDFIEYNRPYYIRLLSDKGSGQYESRSELIPCLSLPKKTPYESSVTYSFEIPRSFLQGTNFNCIGLYSASTESTTDLGEYAAVCSTDGKINEAQISAASALLVDWKLIITNNQSIT